MVFASGYSLGVAADCQAGVPGSFLAPRGVVEATTLSYDGWLEHQPAQPAARGCYPARGPPAWPLCSRHRRCRTCGRPLAQPSICALEPEAGAANLRKAAHHARQALGLHNAIVLHAGEVLLWPERPVMVDALRFEQRADTALAQGDPADCADVAATYTGDLLPGARFEA